MTTTEPRRTKVDVRMTAACQCSLGTTVPDTWQLCLSRNSGQEQLTVQRWLDCPKSTPNHGRQSTIDRWIPSRTSILLERVCGCHGHSDREVTMLSNKVSRKIPCPVFARSTFCAASWRCARMGKLRKGRVVIRRRMEQASSWSLPAAGHKLLSSGKGLPLAGL